MGVTSVRFNKKEEAALEYLKEMFDSDASSLIKKALWELYEDAKDREIVEEFEAREAAGEIELTSIEDLL